MQSDQLKDDLPHVSTTCPIFCQDDMHHCISYVNYFDWNIDKKAWRLLYDRKYLLEWKATLHSLSRLNGVAGYILTAICS